MKDNNIRQHRLESLIIRSLSDIFFKEKNKIYNSGLVSVTQVRLAPDLSVVKIYLSIMPVEKREEIFRMITEKNKFIRKLLGQRIKNIRKIPELIFFIDDSYDYMEKINNLLKE